MSSVGIYNTSSWALPATRPADVITNDNSTEPGNIIGIPHIWLFTSVVYTAQVNTAKNGKWKLEREGRKNGSSISKTQNNHASDYLRKVTNSYNPSSGSPPKWALTEASISLKNCKYWSISVMTKYYAISHVSIDLKLGNMHLWKCCWCYMQCSLHHYED